MALVLYRCLLILVSPLIVLRLLWRGRAAPAYRDRRCERFGRVPAAVAERVKGAVWFHTVSAGESIAAAPVIRAFHERHPEQPLLVTTMTPTGAAQVERLLGDIAVHLYAPYDFVSANRGFLDAVQPKACVLMETELWPNWLRQLDARSVPALLVNARLSERSARGYGRVSALMRPMLQSLDAVACQYPAHAQRFIGLGAPADRVSVLGSVKFDVDVPEESAKRCARWRAAFHLPAGNIWIAASTHDGEDAIVLAAHALVRKAVPAAVLVLVPRHPERFDAVAQLAGADAVRLSSSSSAAAPAVLIGDTMGDLLHLYGLSSAAFVGGSLIDAGGHNPIEAAVHGQSLIMGPHRYNFEQVCAQFETAGCLTEVDSAQALAAQVLRCFEDPGYADGQAALARSTVAANRGATGRLVELLDRRLVAVTAQ